MQRLAARLPLERPPAHAVVEPTLGATAGGRPRPALGRSAGLIGTTLAAAVAVWWLGATRLALDNGANPARASVDALQALWMVRAVAISLLAIGAGAGSGVRSGTSVSLALVAPAWPLVFLVASASTVDWTRVGTAESILVGASAALPVLGLGLRRWLRAPEIAMLAATVLGTAFAALAWRMTGPLFGVGP